MENKDKKAEWELQSVQLAKQSTNLADLRESLKKAQVNAAPATMTEAVEYLTPCLILCAPSGMQQADRTAWYKAAMLAIGDIPRQPLELAAKAALKVCDHPAKIIPFICNHAKEQTYRRHEAVRSAMDKLSAKETPLLENDRPQYMTARDLAEMKQELYPASIC